MNSRKKIIMTAVCLSISLITSMVTLPTTINLIKEGQIEETSGIKDKFLKIKSIMEVDSVSKADIIKAEEERGKLEREVEEMRMKVDESRMNPNENQEEGTGDTVVESPEKIMVTPEEVLASLTELLPTNTKLNKFYQDKETTGDTYYISLEGMVGDLTTTMNKLSNKYADESEIKLISLRLNQDIYDSRRPYDDESRLSWFKGQVINEDKAIVSFTDINDQIEERRAALEADSKYEAIETAKEAELLKLDELIDSSISYYEYLIEREENMLILQDSGMERKDKISDIFNNIFNKEKDSNKDKDSDKEKDNDKEKDKKDEGDDDNDKEDDKTDKKPSSTLDTSDTLRSYSSISKYQEKISQLETIRGEKKAEIESKWDEKKSVQDKAEELEKYMENITLLSPKSLQYKGDLVLKFKKI